MLAFFCANAFSEIEIGYNSIFEQTNNMELSFTPDAKACTTDVNVKKKKGVNIKLPFFRLKFGGKKVTTTTIECDD